MTGMSGGLVPHVKYGRRRYAVERSWWVAIVWLRVRVDVEVTR